MLNLNNKNLSLKKFKWQYWLHKEMGMRTIDQVLYYWWLV